MTPDGTLISVDADERFQGVARSLLGKDRRVSFLLEDGATFLGRRERPCDRIYADAWPGKFSHLDEALALLAPGGTYVIDDLLPQPHWPDGHGPKVEALIPDPRSRPRFHSPRLKRWIGVDPRKERVPW